MQYTPTAAFDGTLHLVLWSENDTAGETLYGARVRGDGVPLDVPGFVVSPGGSYASHHAVVGGAGSWLAVWMQRSDGGTALVASRVSNQGVLLDQPPLTLPTSGNAYGCVAALDGQNFLAVWPNMMGLWGARLTQQGNLLDPTPLMIWDGGMPFLPQVVFDGQDALAVWADLVGVRAARLNPQGAALDMTAIAVSSVMEGTGEAQVASNGDGALVVWTATLPQVTLKAARLSAAGVVLDPSALVLATAGSFGEAFFTLSVAFMGPNYVVSWTDDYEGQRSLRACEVTPQGEVLDAGTLVAHAIESSSEATGDGSGLLLYSRYDSTPSIQSTRLFAVLLGSFDGGFPDAGGADAGTASGSDGGSTDAGGSDGGAEHADYRASCGCASAQWPGAACLLALALGRGRQRAGRFRPSRAMR
jgi:hypothetical protein